MRAADVLATALEKEGVEYVFGVPGEENLVFLDSLRRSSIQFITTRHEQVAGFMAATVGRLTGRPGVCLATLGPGATNMVTAVAYAQLGAMPALFITGQKPIKQSKQGHFQIIDTVGMMRPLTKLTRQITHAPQIPALVREACKLAMEERPGAVHIELPEDIALDELSAPVWFEPNRPRRPLAEDKAIREAVTLIEQARRPLLLVGAGANRKRVSKTLTAFIDKTKIPFFTTQMGKGVVDERHPQYLGTAALSAQDHLHQLIDEADLIINVGHDTIEKPPFLMKAGASSPQVIHLNFSPATPDMVYQPQLEVIGDLANAIWQIMEAIRPARHWELDHFRNLAKQMRVKFAQLAQPPQLPYAPYQVVVELRAALPAEAIVALDNGMYKLWFARHYPTYEANTLLLDNALATMGAGLPSAMAAKLMEPQRPVVAVVGDGGFLLNAQDLETVTRLGLDLVVIILRDDAFGMIEWKQAQAQLPAFGLKFTNPDFVRYAEAYGASGHRVTQPGQLGTLVSTALAGGGLHLIEVPINYQLNQL